MVALLSAVSHWRVYCTDIGNLLSDFRTQRASLPQPDSLVGFPMSRTIKEIKSDIQAHKRDMKARGIKRTSCFNGGLDRDTYLANSQLFALNTELERAEKESLQCP